MSKRHNIPAMEDYSEADNPSNGREAPEQFYNYKDLLNHIVRRTGLRILEEKTLRADRIQVKLTALRSTFVLFTLELYSYGKTPIWDIGSSQAATMKEMMR